MATKFEVRFDIASAYVVEVEAESAEEAVRIVEADVHGFREKATYGGWDLVAPTIAIEVAE